MKKKPVSKIYPDVSGPQYNSPFIISGFQAVTIDFEYTEMKLYEEEELKIIKLKNYRDYRKWKSEFSNKICKPGSDLKDVTTVRIKYIGDADYHYI